MASTSTIQPTTGIQTPSELPYILLIVAVVLAYSNVLDNEFVFDDHALILGNSFLSSWHNIGRLFVTQIFQGYGTLSPFYRPLQMVFYLFLYQIFGPAAPAFHLLNIALHALNACLLFTLGNRLGFKRGAAFIAALLWALHPVQTETIAYISATADSLCGIFLLAGTCVLAKGFTPRRVLLACGILVLALLSKETGVVFPALAMGLQFYQSENRWSPKTYFKTWPFWLVVLLYFLARETVLNLNGFLGFYKSGVNANASVADHFYTFLATLPVYARLLVWPAHLHMERYFPVYHVTWAGPIYDFFLIPEFTLGLALLALCAAGIFWKPSRRATPLSWGLLWAAMLHFPQSGLLAPNDALIYEHWLYLPTMGFALGLSESLARLTQNTIWLQRTLAGASLLIAALFAVMTFNQNEIWRDPVTFFTHILDCGEDSANAHLNLGLAYMDNNQYAEAEKQFRAVLQKDDTNIEAHYNLGALLYRLDKNPANLPESIRQFQRAIALNPDYYKAYDALAIVYEHQGYPVKAVEYRDKANTIRKRMGFE